MVPYKKLVPFFFKKKLHIMSSFGYLNDIYSAVINIKTPRYIGNTSGRKIHAQSQQ